MEEKAKPLPAKWLSDEPTDRKLTIVDKDGKPLPTEREILDKYFSPGNYKCTDAYGNDVTPK